MKITRDTLLVELWGELHRRGLPIDFDEIDGYSDKELEMRISKLGSW
mgnify:FL=1|jgi:hypothetical protein